MKATFAISASGFVLMYRILFRSNTQQDALNIDVFTNINGSE